MPKHIPPRRVPRDRVEQRPEGVTKTVSVPPPHTHVEADITDLSSITVTVSTSAPSGSATDGDLWCRV